MPTGRAVRQTSADDQRTRGPVAAGAAALVAFAIAGALHAASGDVGLQQLLVARPGGAASIVDASSRALTRPVTGLDAAQSEAFRLGEAFFNTDFDTSTGTRRSGLGPLFNSASCSSCHNGSGRGAPVDADGNASIALVMQLSEAVADDDGDGSGGAASLPSARFGKVFNPFALDGFAPDGRVRVLYQPRPVTLADGSTAELRVPSYRLEPADGQAFATTIRHSPRLAPAIVGTGLLDAVPDARILERADPLDRDGDGISGRANEWRDDAGRRRLGRFGWKANQATLEDQIASALANEMGVTSALRPFDDRARRDDPHVAAAAIELSAADLAAIVSFQRFAGMPTRGGLDSTTVRAGAARFLALGCESCHRATLRTGVVPGVPALSGQTIHPFTDLLLHDLGEGLADERPDGAASGREWRTAPLWGLGLTGRVSRRIAYLHDGRARTPTEAILWHGGEAQQATERFIALDEPARNELLAFLGSL